MRPGLSRFRTTPPRMDEFEIDPEGHLRQMVGPRVWAVIRDVERLAERWCLPGIPLDEHHYGRLPGETEIRAWQIPRTSAALLFVLVRLLGCRNILEVGTSLGYSAMWLGAATRALGGQVHTVEGLEPKARLAAEHFERAGLRDTIVLLEGEARGIVESWAAPIDFLFLDADPPSYPDYLRAVEGNVKAGALLVVDNAVDHGSLTSRFCAGIGQPEWEPFLLPQDHGLFIARRSG